MTSAAIRNKLFDYIRLADDKKLLEIYNIIENKIEKTSKWWKNEQFVAELDKRYEMLESGADPGFTLTQLEASMEKHIQEHHAK